VPATTPALPPVDPEADQFLAALFTYYPEARYRITQTAYVQEQALAQAQARIQQLQTDLAAAQQQMQAQPRSGGFFSGIFGGGAAPHPAPQAYPQQTYAPQPQQAYAQQPQQSYAPMGGMGGGSGFLGSALTTAAGVAGGVLAADAITSMFHGHSGFGGGFGGGGFGGGFGGGGFGGGTVVNETVYNNAPAQSDPWGGNTPGVDAGTGDASQSDGWTGNDPGTSADTGGDWGGDSGGNDGGGWDSSGGDSSS